MGSHRTTAEHSTHCRLVHSRLGITVHPVTKQMLLTKHITPMKRPPTFPLLPFREKDGREHSTPPLLSLSYQAHTLAPSNQYRTAQQEDNLPQARNTDL